MPLPVLLAVAALALPPGVDPQLFPDAASRDPVEVQLAGLAALYPGRVLHHEQQTPLQANLGRLPKVVDLPRYGTYLRAYNLDEKTRQQIEDLLAKPTLVALVLDLRYIWADAADAEGLAGVLAKAGLASAPVHGVGKIHDPDLLTAADKHPSPLVLAIVNGQTAGPLEAWLEAFQAKESVLVVGTPTAGQPGTYLPAEGHPEFFIMKGELLIIEGELQPKPVSIAGTGLKPHFAVDVKPEQDYLAWSKVESGVDFSAMLRPEQRATSPAALLPAPAPATGTLAPAAPAPTPAPVPVPATVEKVADPSLQRALDVVAAMQVLHPPPVKPAGTGKTANAAQAEAPASTPR